MQYVHTDDGVRLAYRDVGTGRPLVLVHGLGIGGRIWDYQKPALADRFRVIVPDMRGHGESDKPGSGYSLETLTDDIDTLITELDLDNVAFVGWSLGGYVGSMYAARRPSALGRLVVVASGVVHWGADPDVNSTYSLDMAAVAEERRQDRPGAERAFVDRIFAADVGEDTKRWVWDLCLRTPLYASLSLFDALDGLKRERWREILADIAVPTDVFHGVHDDAADRHVARHIVEDVASEGRYVEFEHSGHVPFVEEKTRFNDQIRMSVSL
jgi:non-heme chloroperoxidase